MKSALKSFGLVIAGMLLWSLIIHGYIAAVEYMDTPAVAACTQLYCLT